MIKIKLIYYQLETGYVLSKSTKKSTKEIKNWIKNDEEYKYNENRTFKVKSKLVERNIKDENNESLKITEKIVCYWSKKHYEKELKENEHFLKYLEACIDFPDKLKDKPRKIEKFLKTEYLDKETGELIKPEKLLKVDKNKIQEYKDLMGYYTISTSEIELSDEDIINKYHGLSRIEDSFRIIKSDLKGRPIYVWTEEHINAHFLICFIALTIIRIMQYKVLKFEGKETLNLDGWEAGITANNIKKSLNDFNADALPQGYYKLSAVDNYLELLFKSFDIQFDFNNFTLGEIRKFRTCVNNMSI